MRFWQESSASLTQASTISWPFPSKQKITWALQVRKNEHVIRDGIYDVMLFAGRRWGIMNTGQMSDISAQNNLTQEDVASFVAANFHAYWSSYPVSFMSDVVDVGTATASESPVGVQWYRIESLGTNGLLLTFRDISTILLCATCDDVTNPCFFNATCQADRSCLRTSGSNGTLCQIPPPPLVTLCVIASSILEKMIMMEVTAVKQRANQEPA